MKNVEFIFPEYTNIYGESYNMEYLKRCSDEINIVETHPGDVPLFAKGEADMVYMGCMTEEKQEKVFLVPVLVGLILRPAGPSASVVAGMPSLGMALVCPAAPGTSAPKSPTVAEAVVDLSPAEPTTRLIFSSTVMASITLSMLALPSFGCAAAEMPRSSKGVIIKAFRIMLLFLLSYLQ